MNTKAFARFQNVERTTFRSSSTRQRGDQIPIGDDRDYGDALDFHPLPRTNSNRITSTHGPIYTTYEDRRDIDIKTICT